MTRRTTWLIACLAGCALLASSACDNANSKNEAEAVESKQQGSSQKNKNKPGAAAKTGDKEKGHKHDETHGDKHEKDKMADKGSETGAKAAIGEPAPDFKLEDAQGNVHQLSEYEGQTVVLEWTSPECPYVERHYNEAETMTKTLEKLGGSEKVKWFAIDSSHFNTPKKSKKWKKKQGFDYPVLQDKNGQVGKLYGAKTTPHMYVIDKEGILRYKGAIDNDPRGKKEYEKRTNYVLNAVQALRKGKDASPKTTEAYGCSVKYEG